MPFEFIEDEIDEEIVSKQPGVQQPEIQEQTGIFGKLKEPFVQYVATPATEFATSALGMPGDIGSLLNRFIAKPLTEAITGQEGVPYEELPIAKLFPTGEQLHQGVEQLTGQELRPKTAFQEILSTGSGFLGALFSGGGGKFLGKGVVPFVGKEMPAAVRNTVAAFGPAAVMVGTEKADLPPWAQVSATVGASLLAHRATGKGLKQINNELYSQVDEMAKDVMMPSTDLKSRLNSLKGTMQKGLTTGPKSRINSLIGEIEDKISGGAIPLEDLIQFRKDIIEVGKEFTKEQMKGSEKFWRPLRSAIDNTINDYKNPQFQNIYREANSLFRGRQESKLIENFISKNKQLSSIAGAGGGLALKLLGVTLGTGTAKLAATTKGVLFTRALARNPGFRKAWKDVLKSASKNEVRATARSLRQFNKIAKEEGLDKENYVSEKEKPRYEFID